MIKNGKGLFARSAWLGIPHPSIVRLGDAAKVSYLAEGYRQGPYGLSDAGGCTPVQALSPNRR
jgi:hypothetical protein